MLCPKRKRVTKTKKRNNNQPEDEAGQRDLAGKKMKSGDEPKNKAHDEDVSIGEEDDERR